MTNMPYDTCSEMFADYILSTYIDENAPFSHPVWADPPSLKRKTNNGPKTFHNNTMNNSSLI